MRLWIREPCNGVCYLRGLSSTWPMGLRENVLRVCLVAPMELCRPTSYILREGKQAQLVQILRDVFGETA